MARAQYGTDPNGNPIELQMVTLQKLDMRPDKDLSKADYLYTKIYAEFSFQWNPFGTASNTKNAAGPPFDDIGLSVQTLREALETPQQTFRFAIGNTLVWEVPGLDPNGLRLPCDPGRGPIPEVLSLTQIEGEYGAYGRMGVAFWVYSGNNTLLSNRWTVAVDVNSNGQTRRTVEGWATMRADAMRPFGGINNVDDFRKYLICPTPAGFRRERVRVKVNEVGTVLNYYCLDVQDMNPLGVTGAGLGCVKFEGEVTSGVRSAFKDYHSVGAQGIGAVFGIGLNWWTDLLGLGANAHTLNTSWTGLMPTSIATGWCKTWCGQQLPKGPAGGPSKHHWSPWPWQSSWTAYPTLRLSASWRRRGWAFRSKKATGQRWP